MTAWLQHLANSTYTGTDLWQAMVLALAIGIAMGGVMGRDSARQKGDDQ